MAGGQLRARREAAYENSRPEIRELVPASASRILDLGCASGAVGAALIDQLGVEVVGIELDHDYAADAEKRLTRVIQADIEAWTQDRELAEEVGEFDCLLAGDILEHLRDPWATLRCAVSLLSQGGVAVISLPNVRYWETFLEVGIRGTWPRREQGIFDRDHLRWFTVADGLALVRQAGLVPVEIARQYRFAAAGTRFDHHARRLEHTPLRPFFCFQFAIVASKR